MGLGLKAGWNLFWLLRASLSINNTKCVSIDYCLRPSIARLVDVYALPWEYRSLNKWNQLKQVSGTTDYLSPDLGPHLSLVGPEKVSIDSNNGVSIDTPFSPSIDATSELSIDEPSRERYRAGLTCSLGLIPHEYLNPKSNKENYSDMAKQFITIRLNLFRGNPVILMGLGLKAGWNPFWLLRASLSINNTECVSIDYCLRPSIARLVDG
ncbi:hypothetical protein F2Q70_00030530 [Brassica cretica]|uniref:Uncharacterized protein n=1 Tax=Brassica cretica TaxID=69181 RepID=A0A8S9FJQ0_BRACR|nr:hypothetical protein F2Q70_00030530 [Brassica cretica]KAF2551130.1 hypothetical protein F2Q68_00034977 [Brassica cretica]